MTARKALVRRYIVCVDALNDKDDNVPRNPSNISRLYHTVASGLFVHPQGCSIQQDVKYHQVVHTASTLIGKIATKSASSVDQQIRDIVLDICENLESAEDELYLFGSGEGAHMIRAVAGILHHMGLPKRHHLIHFNDIYNACLDLIKAGENSDSLKGGLALQYLRSVASDVVNIHFMALFESTKSSIKRGTYDTKIVPAIRHFRHAMAFNEYRNMYALDLPPNPQDDVIGGSFVQAWFLGNHQDIVGGTQHDGLSLHAVQWIMMEALSLGLKLSFDATSVFPESPLSLAFPQFAGEPPDPTASSDILWRLTYTNELEIKMFDLQSVQITKQKANELSHELNLDSSNSLYNAPRNIFGKAETGLLGYDARRPCGTIIHPSLFCVLDRHPRLLEQKRMKSHKENLANFQAECLRNADSDVPPWLKDSELLTSGVKAFRILVCGKTGVGKSTLINKVFGVEMTEESDSYSQGQHDINRAFESPNHPGLLIHDSRGWQAGSDQELELIAQFLRHRAYQKDPAESLHVIWFCVDTDVSRIEEADKRTFETIAQYSNNVPVFIVGTKKDKLIAFQKMGLLDEYMKKMDNYHEANRLAITEADKLANTQFATLLGELALVKSYRVDGHVCISKNDDRGIRSLLTQTLDMLADDRVRLFCVAAQVVDVDKKIDSAITECMRLGTHAIRTAMVPLPFSGIVSTPTVSRIICEHVLLCFGFPKAVPAEVEEVMNRIVLGNLKKYLAVSVAQFIVLAAASSGLALATVGAGALAWLAIPLLSAAPTARMVFKCSAEMILILERSFRYSGKYVSIRQIEDAAQQYVTINTTTSDERQIRLQGYIRDEVDRLVPFKKLGVGFRFNKLRNGFEQIIYRNRFDMSSEYEEDDPLADKMAELEATSTTSFEVPVDAAHRVELPGDMKGPIELDSVPNPPLAELDASELPPPYQSPTTEAISLPSAITHKSDVACTPTTTQASSIISPLSASDSKIERTETRSSTSSSSSRLFSRMSKSLRNKTQGTK